jgi:hypothetical protein
VDPVAKAVFFLVAVILASVVVGWDIMQAGKPTAISAISAAFAAFVVPFMWDAFEAS